MTDVKNWVRVTLCVGLLGVAIAGCQVGPVPAAEVRKPKGLVEFRFTADSTFSPAKEGTPLAIGGAVKTGEESTSLVIFANKAEISLKPETFFEVGSGQTLGKQMGGQAIFQINKSQKDVKVETPHGVTAVLGTTFLIEVNASGTTVLVDEGRVSFSNPTGNSREVNARERLIVPATGPLPAPEKIDPVTVDQIFRPVKSKPAFNQR